MAYRSVWDTLETRNSGPDGREAFKHMYKPLDATAVSLTDIGCRSVDPYELGIAAGRQQSFEECEARIAAMSVEFDRKFQTAREQTVAEVFQAIKTAFHKASRDVYEEVARSAAAALIPHVRKSVTADAITSLLDAMMQSHASNAVASCRITGPKDLIDLLCTRLDALAPADRDALPQTITFADGNDIDLNVDFDGALLKTTIGIWLSRIDEVLSK